MFSRNALSAIIVGAACLLAAVPVLAAGDEPAKELYRRHNCFACHGDEGQAIIENFPDLAGQEPRYIALQVRDILSGARRGGADSSGTPRAEIMRAALVATDGTPGLSDADIAAIAGWLSRQPPAKPEGRSDATSAAAGEQIFRKKICLSCHGPEGKRPSQGYPILAGMKRDYLTAQLKDFRDGHRTNGASRVMVSVMRGATDQEIQALTDYLAQIDPTPAR